MPQRGAEPRALKNDAWPKAGPKTLQATRRACRIARDIARETERVSRDILVDLDMDRAAAARASYAFTSSSRRRW
jgi:hypothetical protein